MSHFKFLPFPLLLSLLLSCQSEISINSASEIKSVKLNFQKSSNFIYDQNLIEVKNGTAKLREVDQLHTANDFELTNENNITQNSDANITIVSKNHTSLSVQSILPGRSSDLVGYWPMDGTTRDVTGKTSTTENGGILLSRNSKIGTHSLRPDGVNEYLSFATTFHSAFTISMWVRYSEFDAKEGLIDGGGTAWFDSYIDTTGQPYFWSRDSDLVQTQLMSSKPVKQNEWSHVVFVLGPKGNKIYVDGALSASTTRNIADGNIIRIGRSTSYYGKQLMDEVAIWSLELTEKEILDIYNTQSQSFSEERGLSSSWSPKWEDVIGHWSMDQNAMDSTELKNNGLATGNITFQSGKTPRKVGGTAASLNGIDGQISINSLATDLNVETGTFVCWVYNEFPDSDTESRYLFRYLDANSDGFGIRFMATNTLAYNYTGTGSFKTAYSNDWETKVPRNKWTHVAATWDTVNEKKIKLFLNGKLAATENQDISASGAFSSFRLGYGTNGFQGRLDDCAIWKSPLSVGEINLVYNYQKQEYAGLYDSPIMNLGKVGEWETLSPITPLPFMKELTPNTSNEQASSYKNIISNFNDNLVGYWPMNEQTTDTAPLGEDIEDKSLNSNHFTEGGVAKLNSDGILSRAVKLDGVNDFLNTPDDDSLDITSDLTISIWMRSNGELADSGVYGGLIGKTNFSGTVTYGLKVFNSSYEFLIRQSDGTYIRARKNVLPKIVDGKWHHIVGVANSTNGSVQLYVDGILQTDSIDMTWDGSIASTTQNLVMGRGYADDYFNGTLDEAAIWDRSLSSGEIQELYRRGANRIKYQVRSCSDPTCSTEEFMGPNGTSETYFTELHNSSLIGNEGVPTGNQLPTNPTFVFDDFVKSVADNQYFQYRILFEAEENTSCGENQCMPELSSINLSPAQRTFGGVATMITKTPLPFNEIKSIKIKESGDCNLLYQLSLDGKRFYFWNGSTWRETTNSKNSKSTIISKTRQFSKQFGPGELYIKTFFEPGTGKDCALEEISILNKK